MYQYTKSGLLPDSFNDMFLVTRQVHSYAGFSVAFGSTGCSGSGGGRAPLSELRVLISQLELARTLNDGGTNS